MIKLFLFILFIQIIGSFPIPAVDLPSPRYFYSLIGINQQNESSVYIAGGVDEQDNILGDVLAFTFYSNMNWIRIGNLSTPRRGLTSTFLKDKSLLFFAGGVNNQGELCDVIDVYNWDLNLWTINKLNHKYSNISSTSSQELGLVFFAGIISYHPLMSGFDILNISTGFCQTILIKSTRIYYIIIDELNQNVILSGLNDRLGKKEIIIYNILSNQTTIFSSNEHDAINSASFLPDKGILAIVKVLSIELFNINNQDKSRIEIPVPLQAYGVPTISYNGLIFLGGGYTYDGSPNFQVKNIIQIYDVNTDSWSQNYFTNGVGVPYSFYLTNLNKPNLLFFIGGISSATLSKNGLIFKYSTSTSMFSLCPERRYGVSPLYSNCNPCIAGFFCPAGSIDLEISDDYAFRICPQGSYCPVNSSNPLDCPSGTFNSKFTRKSINDCINCPAGTFNIFTAQKSIGSCSKCDHGTVCEEKSSIPLPCPSNYYCPSPTKQIPCPPGTFFNGIYATNISYCIPCTRGSFCIGEGIGSQPCEAGSYTELIGEKECLDCPSGFSCGYGASRPQPCQINFYSPKGSSACTPCVDGQFTTGTGSSTCLICPSSKFSFDGWWCMNTYEKLIFVIIWMGTVVSSMITIWKISNFIKQRKKKIIEAGYIPNVKTFLFLEKMQKRNRNLVELVEEKPMLQEDQLRKMQIIIDKLQEKMELLENK